MKPNERSFLLKPRMDASAVLRGSSAREAHDASESGTLSAMNHAIQNQCDSKEKQGQGERGALGGGGGLREALAAFLPRIRQANEELDCAFRSDPNAAKEKFQIDAGVEKASKEEEDDSDSDSDSESSSDYHSDGEGGRGGGRGGGGGGDSVSDDDSGDSAGRGRKRNDGGRKRNERNEDSDTHGESVGQVSGENGRDHDDECDDDDVDSGRNVSGHANLSTSGTAHRPVCEPRENGAEKAPPHEKAEDVFSSNSDEKNKGERKKKKKKEKGGTRGKKGRNVGNQGPESGRQIVMQFALVPEEEKDETAGSLEEEEGLESGKLIVPPSGTTPKNSAKKLPKNAIVVMGEENDEMEDGDKKTQDS